MFKKLFGYFLGVSILGVILFSILIIVTNSQTFNKILSDKEMQYKDEVNKILEEAGNEIQGEIGKITSGFTRLANEIKGNENLIASGLRRINNTSDKGKNFYNLAVVTEKSDEIMTRFPGIQFIFLVDESGKVEYGYPVTPLGYVYPTQFLNQFTAKGDFNTFAIDMGNKNNPISITFGIKLETEGQLNGKYITAMINFTEPIRELHLLNEYLRKDIPGEDRLTGLFLVNTHGYIFSHNDKGFLLKNIREIWPGDMGFLSNRDRLYQENHYFLKTRAIPNTDLILGIMKKKKGLFFSELNRIQKSSYGYLLLIAVLCLLVGGSVAFLSSKKIVKPLNRLSERAEAAEKGDYDTMLELNTGDELEHLSDVMHHFIKKTKENINKLDDELNLAKHVQENLLPKEIKNFKEVEIVFEMKIPKRVGGDYLDIIPLTESKLAIIMADASGKSFYGAFHIMMVRALIHAQIEQLDKSNPSPKKILMEMARSVEYNKIHHGNHGADMVAILFGILDIEKMEFSFCSAGHPPIFHHSNSKNEIMLMKGKGMPLGVGPLDKHVYTTTKFPLQKNDLLFFCSDGLLEQRNSNEEVFGEERTKQLLKKYSGLPISQLKGLIFQEVFSFKGENVEQTDDISLILVRI